jgi:monoamine oxidase
MARTPLMHHVQRAAAEAAGCTRREMLQRAGAAGAAAALGSMARRVPVANAATAPRIVVVGAGLAGLTCAYRLQQAGYVALVHEASERVGGRCWTIRGAFADGQIAEHGGELIDQGHTEVRHLANELGLTLDNLLAAQPNGTEDTGYQNTWEVTRAQAGASGILVDYTGGMIGASFATGTPSSRAQQFLAQIEPVLPGITAKHNGRATIDFRAAYPWTKGSYSYWKPGQYTSFAGAEREQSFDCHFAGEHTSIDFQGYLNGGVESGERAADEIVADLRA